MSTRFSQLVAGLSVLLWAPLARSDPGSTCLFQQNVEQTCGALGCVAADASQKHKGGEGRCGACEPGVDGDGVDQCGGRACLANATCAPSSIPPPVPVWPTFHLLVIDVSTTFADASGYSGKPIVGAGYLFQGAFGSTKPVSLPDGGWRTTVPRFYFDAGMTASFAGAAQNVFLSLGLTAHVPSWPLDITSISLDALYQRTGSTIRALNRSENVDRLGPVMAIGFLYNLFVRAGYVWPLDRESPQGHGAVLVSLVYMRDLLGDLVPDRFQKYIPASLRGPGAGE